MSIRFDAVGDYLSIVPPSANAAYTIMGWVYLSSDLNDYTHFFHTGGQEVYDGDTDFVGTDTDGTTLRAGCAGGTSDSFTTGSALTVAQWYHIAMIRSSATSLKVYLNAVEDLSYTNDVSSRVMSPLMTVGQYNGKNVNGRIAAIKVWDAALSTDELSSERYSLLPCRWANLWAYLPTLSAGSLEKDYSGNGRDFTVNGTLTVEDNPPIAVFPSWEVPGWQGNYTAAVGGGGGNPWYAYAQQ